MKNFFQLSDGRLTHLNMLIIETHDIVIDVGIATLASKLEHDECCKKLMNKCIKNLVLNLSINNKLLFLFK